MQSPSRVIRAVIFVLFSIIISKASFSQDNVISRFISKDADVVAEVRVDKNNAGMSYLIELIRGEKLRKSSKREKDSIASLFDEVGSQDVVGAAFLVPNRDVPNFVLVIRFPGKKDVARQMPDFVDAVHLAVQSKFALIPENYRGRKIMYSTDRAINDFSVFTILDNKVILGNKVSMVKKALDVFDGVEKPITSEALFDKVYSRFTEDYNLFCFINTTHKRLTAALREWEARYHVSILLSAENLDGMGLFLRFLDEDSLEGSITFMTRDKKALFDVVQDDARFFSNILQRKMMYENLAYEGGVFLEDIYADLTIKVSNLRSLWSRLFDKKFALARGLEMYNPTEHIKETRVDVTTSGKTLYLDDIPSFSEGGLAQSKESRRESGSRGMARILFYAIVVFIIVIVAKVIFSKKK